jgi:hypothetical protein
MGVTSDEAENAPRLRVLYGEDSKESKPPNEAPSQDTPRQGLGGMEEQFRCLAFGTFPPVRANGVVPTAERCSAQRPVAHPSGIRAEE